MLLSFAQFKREVTGERICDKVAADGIRSKPRTTRDRCPFGGTPIRHGGVRHILGNRIYLGVISHKDQTYPGEHEAIIDHELWDQVQQRITRAAQRPRTGLINILFEADGKRLIGSYGNKGGRKYRYYVNSTRDNRDGWRLTSAAR